jgi:hypothetical protein
VSPPTAEEPSDPPPKAKWREVVVSLPFYAVCALVWGGAVHVVQGPTGTLGFVVGLVGAGANNILLWLAIKLAAMAAKEEATPKFGAGLTVFGFFLKLPLIMALFYLTKPLGEPAVNGFLNAMGLVFCLLILWAQAKCEP